MQYLFFKQALALGTGIATYSSQNYGAGQPARIKKGIGTALFLYAVWWAIAVVLVFLFAPGAVRLITGSQNPAVISKAALYLKISIPMIPPMAVLVILRNVLQGMRHTLSPLVCSTLELAGKAVFALWLVPVWGYAAVCVCEPVTWVVCCIFIMGVSLVHKGEWKGQVKARIA